MKAARDISELSPAHKRILNALLEAPCRPSIRGPWRFPVEYVMDKTLWSEHTIRRMTDEARKFLKCKTTPEMIELWRGR